MPYLFNLFLADLSLALNEVNVHAPSLGDFHISNLLYANDVILLSEMKVGLQRLITKLFNYSVSNRMTINQKKTKIMVVSNRMQKNDQWYLQAISWNCWKPTDTLVSYSMIKNPFINIDRSCNGRVVS